MGITTIQISNELKDKISELGFKNETYEQIIRRIYNAALKTQLREFLTSGDAIPIDEAIEEAKRLWPKSK